MKKSNLIFAFFFILLGLLTAAAPYSFAHVCKAGEKIMKCFWTARLELFLGLSLALLGFVKLLTRAPALQLGVNIGIIINAAGIFLTPTLLIGVCAMKKMHCHAVAQPVLVVFGILILVTGLVQSVILWKKR